MSKLQLNQLDKLTISAKLYFMNKYEKPLREQDEMWTYNSQVEYWQNCLDTGIALNDDVEHLRVLQQRNNGSFIKKFYEETYPLFKKTKK